MGNCWEWLGNGWGVSNLCAPLRGIPGRGFFFRQKSAPFHKKYLFICFWIYTGKESKEIEALIVPLVILYDTRRAFLL